MSYITANVMEVIPDWKLNAYQEGKFIEVTSKDLEGKWRSEEHTSELQSH